MIPKLKISSRDREFKRCPQDKRDKIVYYYLFESKSHRWIDEFIVGEASSYSRGWTSMGVLHHLGLVKEHKGIFNGLDIKSVLEMLEASDDVNYRRVTSALQRYKNDDYSFDGFEYFVPAKNSPVIYKEVGTSQYTDGVRIEKQYHEILNPKDSQYYTKRGTARPIKVLFNNKVFDAEYRYEGQKDEYIVLQSIRFRKDLKEEFKKVFVEPKGIFTIQHGQDLNHFIFSFQKVQIQYPEDEEKEYAEGKIAYRKHKTRERNTEVIKKAKEKFINNNNGRLYCEACGFDFFEVYGERGKDFIEGHHTKLISELEEGEKTKVEDIAMLCSNCHRMIHRKPILKLGDLKDIIR